MAWKCKILEKSEYKNVYKVEIGSKTQYRANVFNVQKYFDEERDAAKWVDLRLIEKGKEPVNILVRK